MKILVLGNGAREHAIVWKLAQSPSIEQIFCTPCNPGIEQIATCVNIGITDFETLIAFVKQKNIDLTMPGPEVPLVDGIVDAFDEARLKICGPSKAAAALEGSKAFAKYVMGKYKAPTAKWVVFDSFDEAIDYLEIVKFPHVIKADGLAAGKGAIIVQNKMEARETLQKIMLQREFGDAGARVVLEEFMVGEEASVFVVTDGEDYVLLPTSQDHKAIFDGDKGPNTGGMGAYAPAPVMDAEMLKRAEDEVIVPILKGMAAEGAPYRGVLYAGLMITNEGPKVVEFNCRFGDPETQAVLPLIKSDFAELLFKAATGDLKNYKLETHDEFAVGVVMASSGYPGAYETGKTIDGLDKSLPENRMVFHAGTKKDVSGNIVTSGGRVLTAVAQEKEFKDAQKAAYDLVKSINYEGVYFRKDIGDKAKGRF